MRRATPRATARPTKLDLAWAAGFLEGEGSFLLTGRAGHQTSRVMAFQKQREPLNRLQRIFGGSVTKLRTRDIHTWTVCGARARGVMMTLFLSFSPDRQSQI